MPPEHRPDQTNHRSAASVVGTAGRCALLVTGSLIATTTYAITIRAELGLGPLFAFQAGIAHHVGVSIGTAVIITGLLFVLVALCLRTQPGVGTLILPFLGGITLDWVLPHIPVIHGLAWRFLAVIVATWIMALGGALMFRGALGVSSYDSVMLGLHKVTHLDLAPLRIGMELTMLVLGWALGGAVGVGTVITGLLIGPGLQFWIRLLGDIPEGAVGVLALHHDHRGRAGALERVSEPDTVADATWEAADSQRPGWLRWWHPNHWTDNVSQAPQS